MTDSDGTLAGPTERIGPIRDYREGAVGGGMFTDYPYIPPPMAKRSKMFKQISNVHVETVQDEVWSSFLKLQKQDPSMRSAYIDKVRISWVIDSDETGDAQGNGLLFVASHDNTLDSTTPANNDGNIISASASRGGGGVVTLDVRRRITIDYDGASADTLDLLRGSSGAPVYLHMYKSDTNQDANYLLVVETWGRWFSAESL